MTADQFARFLSKVDRSGDCWIWTGLKGTRGYGRVRIGGTRLMAHRAAYEHVVGPIPAGMEIDHLCRKTSCVNPSHLEAVLHAMNVRRGAACITSGHYIAPTDDERAIHRAVGLRPERLAQLRRISAARTPETFAKISAAHTGKSRAPHTIETRQKMADARRRYWARKRGAAA